MVRVRVRVSDRCVDARDGDDGQRRVRRHTVDYVLVRLLRVRGRGRVRVRGRGRGRGRGRLVRL